MALRNAQQTKSDLEEAPEGRPGEDGEAAKAAAGDGNNEGQGHNALQEENIDLILDTYLEELKDPKELLNECVQRSRDRYQREYAKLKAFQQHQKFYSDDGVKDRAQSLKFKLLVKDRHGDKFKKKLMTDADIRSLPTEELRLSMLILHNTKIKKVMDKYKVESEKKQKAKELGITLKELEEREGQVLEIPVAKKKKVKTSRANSKNKGEAKAKKGPDFEILVKEKPDDRQEPKQNDKANDQEEGKQPEEPQYQPGPIEAENTLEMLQNALDGNFGADQGAKDSKDKDTTKKPPAKKAVAKKKTVSKKKKEEVDSLQRFFNNYGENPHLQQIENGYLKFLEAQHAKESHLKAIKKFQILHALKKI